MALVKFGAGIVQMSGSIAGVTHARNRFGNYVRPRTKPVNPNSSYQSVIRTALSYLAIYWSETLSASNRTGWNTYAAAVAMKNRLGETTYMTGFNHFLRANIVRIQLGQNLVPTAPTVLSLPDKDSSFALAAYADTQKLHITWDDDLPWTEVAASVLGIWQGVPQLATRNFFNGPWRVVAGIAGNGESPTLLTAPFTLVAGQKLWVYGRVSTGPTDCRLSEPFYASTTVIAVTP